MEKVFLSYKTEDRPVAKLIADGLEAEGVSVWWDPELRGGDTYDAMIERKLHGSSCVVVLWSPASVGSRWVRAEATVADRRKLLLPAMIAACERPIAFELVESVDLVNWRGDRTDLRWIKFVDDVRAKIASNASSVSAEPVGNTMEEAYWQSVQGSQDPEDYQSYLQRFSDSSHSKEASDTLRALTRRGSSLLVIGGIVAVGFAAAAVWFFLQGSHQQPPATTTTATTIASTVATPSTASFTPQDMIGIWAEADKTCNDQQAIWNVRIEGGGNSAAVLVWEKPAANIFNREQIVQVGGGVVQTRGNPAGQGYEQTYYYTRAADGVIEGSFHDGVTPPWRYIRCR